jgi:hypothetical protein
VELEPRFLKKEKQLQKRRRLELGANQKLITGSNPGYLELDQSDFQNQNENGKPDLFLKNRTQNQIPRSTYVWNWNHSNLYFRNRNQRFFI